MFANYLKTALRNLMRQKLFSFINIVGLAIGLAAFILILLFVRDEMSWDLHWDRAEDTYRLETTIQFPVRADRPSPNAVTPMKDLLLDTYSEVEVVTRYLGGAATINNAGELFVESVAFAEPNFAAFFSFSFLQGSKETALLDLNSIVISQRIAEKYFGSGPALGKTLAVRVGGEFKDFSVTGVIENPTHRTHMPLEVIVPFNAEYFEGARWFTDDWRFAIWLTYVRFAGGTDVASVQADLPALIDRHMPKTSSGQETGRNWGMKLDLVPIKDIHLYGNNATGDAGTLYGFVAIAFLILLIAVINFLNLSMARVAHRAREVAMRKVVGATRSQIIQQFMGESLLLVMISVIAALVVVEVSLPYYSEFLTSIIEMDLLGEPSLLLALSILCIGVGLSAGSLHALYFSVLKPRDVLYSSTGPDGGGSKLRLGLVVAQFSVSVALMTIAFFVNKQTDYTRSMDLGFNDQNLIVVAGTNGTQSEEFRTRILQSPFVLDVGRSSDVPTEGSEDRLEIRPVTGGDTVTLDGLPTGPGFFSVYQIPLVAGRYLTTSEQDTLRQRSEAPDYKSAANIVVNASGARLLGFNNPADAVGQTMRADITSRDAIDARIVGVVEDFHFDSARDVIRPGIYYVDYLRQSDMSVRIDGNNRDAAIDAIEQVWQQMFPGRLMNYRDMSELVERQYQTDARLGDMLTAFTLLAVTISCLGLYGLASFTVERRTREIGVRKVLGAGLFDIVRLLLWQFAKPILIANLIAWPVAFYFIRDWLNGFAYRIEIDPTPFVFTGVLALVIGWVTVAGHAYLVARANPIDALRYE